MIRICFVCLGNICRSPMAEYILKSKSKESDIKGVHVESRGISSEEQGNPLYQKAQIVLENHNIEIGPHKARCIEKEDFSKFDYFICMEDYHVGEVKKVLGNKASVLKLQDYNIEDPWYTNNFEKVYQQIFDGCCKIIEKIQEREM